MMNTTPCPELLSVSALMCAMRVMLMMIGPELGQWLAWLHPMSQLQARHSALSLYLIPGDHGRL